MLRLARRDLAPEEPENAWGAAGAKALPPPAAVHVSQALLHAQRFQSAATWGAGRVAAVSV